RILLYTPIAAFSSRRVRNIRVSGSRQIAPRILLPIARILAGLRTFLLISRLREDHTVVAPVLGERQPVAIISRAPARSAAAIGLSEQSSGQDQPWKNRNQLAHRRANQN